MYGRERGRRGRATSWRRAAATRQLLSSHGLCFASNGRCCVCAPLPGPEVPLAFGTLKATLPLQQGISTSSNSARAQWGRRLPQLSSCCPPHPAEEGAGRGVTWLAAVPGHAGGRVHRAPMTQSGPSSPRRALRLLPSCPPRPRCAPAPLAVPPASSPGPRPGCVHCLSPHPVSIVPLARSAPWPPHGVRTVLWHTSLW